MALTDKQKFFCEEYLVDLDATKAAIRAGYSEKTAYSIGSENLRKPELEKYIAQLKKERLERNNIDADYVLRQAVELHERCMQSITPVMVRQGRRMVQATDEDNNLLFKFDARGAASALKLVGDHVKVQAFKEQVEVNHKIDLKDAIRQARERARGNKS